MVIYTNSGRIKKYRKLIIELLLAAHCQGCTTCVKSGECILQELAHRLGVRDIRFENTREHHEIDDSSPHLCGIPTSVSSAAIVYAPVKSCRELGFWALLFGEPMLWSCLPLTKRLQSKLCQLRTVPGILSHGSHFHQESHG